MLQEIYDDLQRKAKKSLQVLSEDFAVVRTGRATPALLDKVEVEYYGTKVPLKQLASVSAQDARTLVINPYDINALSEIEKAILKANLGFTPMNDGKLIRINIPPLTEERRKELVKQIKKMAEETKIAVRNLRREANDKIKKLEKDSKLGKDEAKKATEKVQEITDEFVGKIDKMTKIKENDIMNT